MNNEVFTDGTGTFSISPTGTGLKFRDGGMSFDGTTPVAGSLTGATIVNPNLTFAVVNNTTASLALTAALHGNRTVTLSRAAGMAVTLPAAAGSGVMFRLVVAITFTGASTIKVVDATDYMIGTAVLFADGGDTVVGFATANTGTLSTESDTVDLLGTANSTGGIKGSILEFIDIATDIWAVRIVSDAGGTEATPFSATV